MTALDGIDVSHNNTLNGGPIDWRAVATTTPALDFVMARMTHGGHGDNDLRTDRQAANNKAGMRQWFPNAARGFYHFLGTSTPTVQAAHFAKVTGPLQPGEFVMLDVEPDPPAQVPILSTTQIRTTLEAIEREFGATPFLYIGRYYSGSLAKELWRFPLILPAYTTEATYNRIAAEMGRPVVVWQWGGGGNGATVPGISGRIDSNRIEDMPAFRAALVPAPKPPRPDVIIPTPDPPTTEDYDMACIITASGRNPFILDGGYAHGVGPATMNDPRLPVQIVDAGTWDELVATSDAKKAADKAAVQAPTGGGNFPASNYSIMFTGTGSANPT